MKMKEMKINKQRYRYYYEGDVWVCDNGCSAFRRRPNSYLTCGYDDKWCKMQIRKDGNKYVQTREHGDIRMDYMVATCFCPPNPGIGYELCHTDGDTQNCCYKNLEWRPVTKVMDPKNGMMKAKLYEKSDCWVYENGTVMDGYGNQIKPIDFGFDSDTASFFETDPYIKIDKLSSHLEMDRIMNAVGFVQGDKSSIQNPVIMHRDGDYRNFSSDNLEWIESSDQRYQDYAKKKYDDMVAYYEELNKGITHPPHR